MKTVEVKQLQEAVTEDGNILLLPCTVNIYYITTNDQAREAVNILLPIAKCSEEFLAIDVETSGLDPYLSDILLLQIGTKDSRQYVFDIRKIDINILNPILDSNCWKLGHNIKFDAKFIKVKSGITLKHFFDTMIAEQVIRGGEYFEGEGYSLDDILKRRLGKELRLTRQTFTSNNSTLKVKKQMQQSFLNFTKEYFSEAQLAYAAQDVSAELIFELSKWQTERLKKCCPNTMYDPNILSISNTSIRENYEKMFPPALSLWNTALLEFKFIEVVVDLELTGVGFNTELHREVLNNIEKDYLEYKKEFLSLLSKVIPQKTLFGSASVNPDSNKQVLESLNTAGIKIEDTGANTLEATLRELQSQSLHYKIVESLLNYRTASKLLQAFGTKLASHVHPITGRIHCDVKQILDTGRISTSNPNNQQIPRTIDWKTTGNEEKDLIIKERQGIRECFQPRSGYRFIIYDYSAQELRVVASISLEKTMLKAFLDNKDLHSYSATLMYGGNYEEFVKRCKEDGSLEKNQRQVAKTVSFGSLYGSGPPNLARVLHIDLDQARDILDRFWASYPSLKQAMSRYGELANRYGYSNTVLGRRRYYTNIVKQISWVKAEHNPKNIEKLLTDLGMFWVLEEGPVTEQNMQHCIKQIVRKYEGNISRQAANHHVQGTSADCSKLAAIRIRNDFIKYKLDATIVILVHDEIIVEAKSEDIEACESIIKKRMNEALNFFCPNVPSEVEGHVSDCWKK